jgi:hypothetical protein
MSTTSSLKNVRSLLPGPFYNCLVPVFTNSRLSATLAGCILFLFDTLCIQLLCGKYTEVFSACQVFFCDFQILALKMLIIVVATTCCYQSIQLLCARLPDPLGTPRSLFLLYVVSEENDYRGTYRQKLFFICMHAIWIQDIWQLL